MLDNSHKQEELLHVIHRCTDLQFSTHLLGWPSPVLLLCLVICRWQKYRVTAGSLKTAMHHVCGVLLLLQRMSSNASTCSPCPPPTFNLDSWIILGVVIWGCWMHCMTAAFTSPSMIENSWEAGLPTKIKGKWENLQWTFLVDLPNSSRSLRTLPA